ncbi:M56 family metallopeptidase [Fulvimonas yonginensis]|uniref:M56 family metallopeptidase n=1 Tax=Fulvimonas yonginensis TaxID=1495200 RepID=A0ABU8JA85_9GAMM
MSIDPSGVDWLGRSWRAVLAFTVAVPCVALLRRPCRRLFGAEHAFALWLLPPLAVLAGELPHATASTNAWSSALAATLPSRLPLATAQVPALAWQAAAAWLWLAGAVASLALAAWAQARYCANLRRAVPLAECSLAWPVLRADSPCIGPALVGALRPRIVVPADFGERYAADERALVLAHEAMHARRRDGWWSLMARVSASLLWFHPLAWWALAALRRDQELACDAAVVREHAGSRRRYVQALLKAPAAHVLPVGCSWSFHHPLTERIAMLRLRPPSLVRRRVGLFAGLVLAASVGAAVYAASAPTARSGHRQAPGPGLYQLDIQLALTGDDAGASHARRLKAALCTAPGKTGTLRTEGIQLAAVPVAIGQDRVRLDLAISQKADAQPVSTRLEGPLGQRLQASGTVPGEGLQYALEVTPHRGCPASATAAR